MRITLDELARALGAELEGDGAFVIHGVAGLDEAGPGHVSFLANPRYAEAVGTTRAGAVIVARDHRGAGDAALLRVDDPYLGFLQVLKLFSAEADRPAPGIHPTAVVDGTVEVAEGVSVAALCVVETGARLGRGAVLRPGVFVGRDSVVGEDAYLHPNVTVRERVVLGARVIVHSGTVIGSDGFGYATRDGVHEKIPQVGTVEVGDDVEIGANVTVDRGTMGATRIESGVKIDNLVHLAHNVTVGSGSLLVAQVGVSGSTQIGKGVTLAGQAGLVGHLEIGDGAMVAGQAGVTKSVPAGARVSGYPAMDHGRALRLHAYSRQLPSLFERVRDLEACLEELGNRPAAAAGPRQEEKEERP